MDKKIIGVWTHGHAKCEIPKALDQLGDAIVAWNGKNIVDAITGKYFGYEDMNGNSIPPRSIPRIKCQ